MNAWAFSEQGRTVPELRQSQLSHLLIHPRTQERAKIKGLSQLSQLSQQNFHKLRDEDKFRQGGINAPLPSELGQVGQGPRSRGF